MEESAVFMNLTNTKVTITAMKPTAMRISPYFFSFADRLKWSQHIQISHVTIAQISLISQLQNPPQTSLAQSAPKNIPMVMQGNSTHTQS